MAPRLQVFPGKGRWFPVTRALLAVISVLAITVYLYWESRGTERVLLEAETVRQADNVSVQFQGLIQARVDALRNAADFLSGHDLDWDPSRTTGYFTRLTEENPGFAAVAVLDPDGKVLRQVSSTARSDLFAADGSPPLAAAIAKARATRNIAGTDAFALPPGHRGFTLVLPVKPGDGRSPFLAGTIDLTKTLGSTFGPETLDYWSLAIWDHDGNEAYRSMRSNEVAAPAASNGKPPPLHHLPVADRTWKFRISPTPLLLDTYHTPAPRRILAIGLLSCVALAAASHLLARREARLAETLRESERLAADVESTRQRLSDLVNGIDAVIWESDAHAQHFTFVNDYARKLLRVEPSRWIAKPSFWFEHVHPDDLARARAHSLAVTEPGRVYPIEYRMIDARGEVIWVRELITAIGAPGSARAVGRRGIIVDITARVRAEEALRQGQKLESLGVLAGGIAHDFNNLLTTILGNAEMLRPQLTGAAAGGRDHLDRIERTTRRLAELTRQMLAYSGRGRFIVTSLDINAVITEMDELLAVSTPKNVSVRYHLAPDLARIEADSVQIRQVVLNLLTNAAEAIGEQAGGEVTVHTENAALDAAAAGEAAPGWELAPGRYVKLEVSDTGCGMSEETVARIFDPFFTTKFTGRGLGLAALQGIVRGHHGGVHIFSQPGEGTVFTLYFPASGEPASGRARDGAAQPAPVALENRCVLFVDDEDGLRTLMASALEDAGCRVIQARDGVDGVEQFRRHGVQIDVVVLDLTMPRLSGEEAFHRMVALRPEVCVIISSGYTQEDVARQFSGQSLGGFIEKPFTPSELIEKIRSTLAAWHPQNRDNRLAVDHPV